MKSYRDVLYANYSENFGEKKAFDPELQYAVYEGIYCDLPDSTGLKIADLGCGKGEWLAWMNSKGFRNLTGIDIAASELVFSENSGIETVTGDITTELNNHPDTYDLLHAKDVLEHLTKDEAVQFLEACLASLKPGGEIWILTFNAQSPLANATRYGDFTHELGVTPGSLAQLLRATGFEVKRVRGFLAASDSLSGKIRRFAFAVFSVVARFFLRLRHGQGANSPTVELCSVKPDLMAVARKK